MPVVMHQGTGHDMIFYRGWGSPTANLLTTQSMAPRAAALLSCSGVLERHPDLHVVMVEVNAGWMAWTMSTLDEYYLAHQRHRLDETHPARAPQPLPAPSGARHVPGRPGRHPQHPVDRHRLPAVGQRLPSPREHLPRTRTRCSTGSCTTSPTLMLTLSCSTTRPALRILRGRARGGGVGGGHRRPATARQRARRRGDPARPRGRAFDCTRRARGPRNARRCSSMLRSTWSPSAEPSSSRCRRSSPAPGSRSTPSTSCSRARTR